MKEIEIRVGGDADLQSLCQKWPKYDAATVKHYWKKAQRRGHLLVIHPSAGGWGMIGVLPPKQYDFTTRKIPNRFIQTGHLGVALPWNATFIFGPEEFIEKFNAEAKPDAILPAPQGGETIGKSATPNGDTPKKPRGKAKRP